MKQKVTTGSDTGSGGSGTPLPLFVEYLLRARVTDDPTGDLIGDARRDPLLKDRQFIGITAFKRYVRSRSGCEEAVAECTAVWQRYKRWLKTENGRAAALRRARAVIRNEEGLI